MGGVGGWGGVDVVLPLSQAGHKCLKWKATSTALLQLRMSHRASEGCSVSEKRGRPSGSSPLAGCSCAAQKASLQPRQH